MTRQIDILSDDEAQAVRRTLSELASDIASTARGYDLVAIQVRPRDSGGEGPRVRLRLTVQAPGSPPRSELAVWLPIYRWLSVSPSAEQMGLDTMKGVWVQTIEPWLNTHGIQSNDKYPWITGLDFLAMDWRR